MDSFGVPADGEYSSESETECHGKEARVLYSKVEDAKVRYLRGVGEQIYQMLNFR